MRELLSAVVGPTLVPDWRVAWARLTRKAAAANCASVMALGVAFAAAPVVAAECGAALKSPQVLRWSDKGVTAVVAVDGERFVVGRPLPIRVALCGRGDETLAGFDADMPAHRHGMNYRASWKPQGAQTWAVEGVLLHMPGAWRLIVDVQRGAERLRLTQVVDVP